MKKTLIGAAVVGASSLLLFCKTTKEEKYYTAEGQEYTILQKGQGPKAKPGDLVRFYYRVLDDNEKVIFDQWANGQPQEMRLIDKEKVTNKSPILMILYELSEGDSAMIEMPAVSSQNMRNANNKTLKAIIKVVDVVPKEELARQEPERTKSVEPIKAFVDQLLQQYNNGQLSGQLLRLPSGLEIYFKEKTDGPVPVAGNQVKVHYYGVIKSTGKLFDNSLERGHPIEFALGRGQVIPGWEEAMQHIPVGSKAVIFIPYALAYGERGYPPVIPPQADLVFYVEVLEAQ